MYKYELGEIITTNQGNKIIVVGLELDGTYVISANNGRTTLARQTEEDIERYMEE